MNTMNRNLLAVLMSIFFFGSLHAQITFYKTDKVNFLYSESGTSKNLYVRGNVVPAACFDPQAAARLRKATLHALIDWKSDDVMNGAATEYRVILNIQEFSTFSGMGGLLTTYTHTLTVKSDKPQSYVAIDFTGMHPTIERFVVTPTYSLITGPANANVQAVLQTDVYFTEEYDYIVPTSGSPMLYSDQVVFNGNEATFKWRQYCPTPAPNFQFQLLRLFNNDVATSSSETNITTLIDWDRAMTIETGNSLREISLTLAEGTGYYIWRVRPIGNAYEGGAGNDLNWGVWSATGGYTSSTTNYVINTGASPYLFFYNQFDDGMNWIFSRSFMEGDAQTAGQVVISESMNYANGLQMAMQQQTRMRADKKKLVGQTVYDYSGRPALTSMAAPVNDNSLGYISSYVKNALGNTYSAADFDDNANYFDPEPFDQNTPGPGKYYSNNNDLESDVPTADGYAYSRTLYMNDGTSEPKEQSSPGPDHRINHSPSVTRHTIRNFSASVSDIELINVLGDEAPAANSVMKNITTDANNGSTITYVSKEGQTIITCLSGTPAPNLDPLPAGTPITAVYELNNNTPYGSTGLSAFSTIGLSEPTTVTITYSITPNVYENACVEFCATCDYWVTIKITDNDDPTGPLSTTIYTTTINPTSGTGSCSGSPTTYSTTIALPAGSFTIERIIEAYQTDPLSSPPTSYIDQFVDQVETAMHADFNTGTAVIVDDLGVPVPGAPSVNMATLRGFIPPLPATSDLDGLYAYLAVGPTQDHVNLQIGCHTVVFPIMRCASAECPVDNDFEKYFTDWYSAHYGTTTTISTLMPQYSAGEFNTVVDNMINCVGYDCQALYTCWRAIVSSYESINDLSGTDLSASYNGYSMPSGSTFTPDYLDMFLDCAGYKLVGINNNPGGSGCSNLGYKFHPYAYFQYTSTNRCTNCESSFYMQPATTPPNPLATPTHHSGSNPYTWANETDFTLDFNASGGNYEQMKMFFNCIQLCNTTGSTPSSFTAFTTDVIADAMETCEERYAGFVALIIEEYHRNNVHVEGDQYQLQFSTAYGYYIFNSTSYTYNPSTDIPLSTIYCEAQGLVEACKAQCVLTVSTTSGQTEVGTPAEIEAMGNALYGVYDLAIPSGSSCPSGYSSTATGLPSTVFLQYAINALNSKLNELRSSAPVNGFYWNFNNFLQTVDPVFATSKCDFGDYVFIHPDIPSYFDFENAPTGVCNTIVYYFNKASEGSIISPKRLYSLSLVSAAVPYPSEGFNYVCTNTVTPTAALTQQTTDGYLSYMITTGFSPLATSVPGTYPMDLTSQYISGIVTDDDALHSYRLGSCEDQGFYKVTLCSEVCSTTVSCPAICYKIGPAPVIPIESTQFEEQGVLLLDISCEQAVAAQMLNSLDQQVGQFIDDEVANLRNEYRQKCINELVDKTTVSFELNYHHYTLYYYDRAGNLVKTVPPQGVTTGYTSRSTPTAHTLVTEYAYNSLQQMIRQKTPDGGETKFWYNSKAQLRFSKNAKQVSPNKMSFTKYDNLGRVITSGEMPSLSGITLNTNLDVIDFPAASLIGISASYTDITMINYSDPPSTAVAYFGGQTQRYLQNRVSYGYSDKDGLNSSTGDRVYTHYSYDPHGNVEWLIQDIPEIGKNYIGYEYDLISGSVLKVKHNEEFPDKFFHRYSYDESKRLKTAETSKDGLFWEKDATYKYYLHGPLKRAEIGHDKIQGLDYTYTIMGWLKGMNHIDNGYDPGKDGNETGNTHFAKDAYGMLLGYYEGDYISKTSRSNSETTNPYYLAANSNRDLYNGNISTWSSNYDYTSITGAPLAAIQHNSKANGRVFNYDELNRITTADFKIQDPVTKLWSASTDYAEQFSYYADGDFKNLTRKGFAANPGGADMDAFTYNYMSASHKLASVADNMAYTSNYTIDIDNQTNPSNYGYDAIGNLTSDVAGGITSIAWNPQGKVSKITKSDLTLIEFLYDMMGRRVYKKVYKAADPVTAHRTTYYVPDASGNSMAIYTRTNSGTSPNFVAKFTLDEQPIYGSDRVGERIPNGEIFRDVNFTAGGQPLAQSLPTPVNISAWPKMLIPLANDLTTQVYNKPMNLSSGTNTAGDLGTNTNSTTVSGLTAQHRRNQTTLFDNSGNVLLTAYTYLTSAPADVPKIYKAGNAVIFNSNLISSAAETQSVFIKRPGADDEYFYVTIDASKKAYFHTVDVSAGAMLNYNNPIDNSLSFGQSMTAIDDRTGTSVLYLVSYSGTTATIRPYTVTYDGFVPAASTFTFTSSGTGSLGDMQISSGGTKLAFANTVSGSTGEVRMFNLNANHLISGLAGFISFAAGTNARSVEFTHTESSTQYIYFTHQNGSTWRVYRQLVSAFGGGSVTFPSSFVHSISSANMIGFIRRGSSNNLYYLSNLSAALITSNLYMISGAEGTPVVSSANAISSSITIGSLPVKPHVIDYQLPTAIPPVLSRQLDRKVYELKDHLGNVHATIGDYKKAIALSGTPDPNVKVNKKFDNGTTESFTAAGGATVGTSANRLSVNGTLGGAATITFTSGLGGTLPAGRQYILNFDYNSGNTALASYKIATNLSANMLKGYMSSSGSQQIAFDLLPGVTSVTITVTCEDVLTNRTFYIDNVLIKDVTSTMTDPIVTLNDNFTSGGNWVPDANAVVTYPSGLMQVTRVGAPATFSVGKDIPLVPGLLHKITFAAALNGTAGGTLNFEYTDEGNTQVDYSYFVRNTVGAGGYTYYFIPTAPQGAISFAMTGMAAGTFTLIVDNVVVTQYENNSLPLYTAQVKSLTDYYAFGAQMPGRNYVAANSYRYGFNEQEKDNDIYGEGNAYSFEYRIQDSRLGRFLSVDPLSGDYPYYSPYQFAGNKPIQFVDIEGLEEGKKDKSNVACDKIPKQHLVKEALVNVVTTIMTGRVQTRKLIDVNRRRNVQPTTRTYNFQDNTLISFETFQVADQMIITDLNDINDPTDDVIILNTGMVSTNGTPTTTNLPEGSYTIQIIPGVNNTNPTTSYELRKSTQRRVKTKDIWFGPFWLGHKRDRDNIRVTNPSATPGVRRSVKKKRYSPAKRELKSMGD